MTRAQRDDEHTMFVCSLQSVGTTTVTLSISHNSLHGLHALLERSVKPHVSLFSPLVAQGDVRRTGSIYDVQGVPSACR